MTTNITERNRATITSIFEGGNSLGFRSDLDCVTFSFRSFCFRNQ